MKRSASLFVAFLSLIGCGSPEPSETERTASTEQAVTLGVPALTQDLPRLGVVKIVAYATGSGSVFSSVDGYCSGTLLSNRWVLTARHCFCQASVNNPGTVTVSVYGSIADGANPQLGQLYSTTAAQIVRHPNYDVALIKLNQTLPFYEPPYIYKGTGTNLTGSVASAWGFGNDQLSGGHAIGLGEALNWTVLNISRTGTTPTNAGSGCTPQETDLPASGPWAVAASGNGARLQDGDSGGPLFLEPTSTVPDVDQHQLVGVYRGDSLGTDGKWIQQYTGIWLIRDWIRTTAPDLAPRSVCPATIPDSVGATAPAVAEGPEGAIHIVAIQSNGVLGHWRFQNGSLFKAGTIAGTLTSHAPAMGLEPQVVGTPRMMGLAYRDRNTGTLKYVRWSGATWSVPIDVPGSATPAGPAMANGGAIAYITAGNRVAATAYVQQSNSFFPAQLVPAGAPTADPTKRLSIVEDLTSGFAEVGYRTTANEWVQTFGSSNCVSLTGSFWCNPDPKYSTDWSSAALAWAPGQRVGLVTTRLAKPTDPFSSLENRVISGPASFTWGRNRMFIAQEPGVAQIGFDTWLATATANNGLTLAHTDNCFANDW